VQRNYSVMGTLP